MSNHKMKLASSRSTHLALSTSTFGHFIDDHVIYFKYQRAIESIMQRHVFSVQHSS